MNTPTLSQLADIGAKAAYALDEDTYMYVDAKDGRYKAYAPLREAFTKAVLDAVGYKFPVDPEREAFEKWHSGRPNPEPFDAWKAGREELRKEVCSDKCEDTKTEPAWIEWEGGPCPIPDTVERWEYKLSNDDVRREANYNPSSYAPNWEHKGTFNNHIVAYRVLDWGTTKQPE